MTASSEELIQALDARVARRESRRAFFTAALTAGAIGAGAFAFANKASAQAVGDADVLNFALNLEYLEANFYSFAVTGEPLAASYTGGTGTLGKAFGGHQVPFTDPAVASYAAEISADELSHVIFLRQALGDAAVAQPRCDLSTGRTSAFTKAAIAAGLIKQGERFDPYSSDENFLLGAFIFEDVGVTAYKGAAALITNKTYLDAAAGILAAEAYHAGIIRTSLFAKGIDTLVDAASAISNARDSLDGPDDLDQGIKVRRTDMGTVSNIAPLDDDGIAFSRTTGQVLNIVYLNSDAVSMGGFFPNGVNGSITTSAASTPTPTPSSSATPTPSPTASASAAAVRR